MTTSTENLQRLAKAYNFAAQKHRKQRRKDTEKTPYINHPIDVVNILTETGVTDTDTLIAGVLHDTIEDTDTTPEEITKEFGEHVTKYVLECSDDKSLDKVARKRLQIEHALHISDAAKLVKLADKYSNCRDLFLNPPSSWTVQEIQGYAYWAYAVCQNLYGVNNALDEKLRKLFKGFGISDLTGEDLNGFLEMYYKIIDKSN